jgi:hypothetical protein
MDKTIIFNALGPVWMMRLSKTLVSQNHGFINQRDKTMVFFLKKEVMSGVSKTPKRLQF